MMTDRRGAGGRIATDPADTGSVGKKPRPQEGATGRPPEDRASPVAGSEAGQPLPAWAERLQALVAQSGLRQAELARRAGLQRDALGRYVRGLTRPPPPKLLAIARVLGVRPEEIDPDRPDLAGVEIPDAGPPRYRLTPARSGDSTKIYLEVAAEVDTAVAFAVVELLNKSQSS